MTKDLPERRGMMTGGIKTAAVTRPGIVEVTVNGSGHGQRKREGKGNENMSIDIQLTKVDGSGESRGPKTIPAPANDLFVLDKRGDPLILQYGTNDRSTIPSYYRFGAGRLIGSPGFLTLHRDGATEHASAPPLSTHLRAHPTDIPAWHRLIALQPALFSSQQPLHHHHPTDGGQQQQRTAEETKSLAELKVGLYQQALGHAADPADREALVLGMMAEAGRVWEEKVLVKKWDELVEKEKGRRGATWFGLWKGRLDFEMGRVGAFSVEAVRGEMVGRLRELGAELERDVGDGEQQGEVCEQVVYVFLRLTRLLGDAGFEELAVAAWQAVLEMVFCRPEEEGVSSAEAMVEAFGEFWESEVARVGEEGARGWRHFVEVGEGAVEPPEPRAEMHTDASKTADPFRAWAAAEQRRAEKARMPARTLDEGTDDDPFRVVMFSDIKDLLVWFPSTVLPLSKALLVEAFLVFCGLPPTGISGEQFAAMLKDPFVAGRGQGLDLDLDLDKNDAAATPDLSRLTPDFGQQGGGMAISPELLFSRDSWFRYLDKWSSIFQPGDTQVDVSWVLRTLGYLVKDCGVEDLAEYYLAMEWLNEPTGARKVAKGLLKKYSANTRLYNAYALLEWANSNPEVSSKVLSSATHLSLSSTSNHGQLLWNTWAWIHIESDQQEMALGRLCSSADKDFRGSTVSPALLLKTKSHFSSTRDYSLSSQELETATQYAESLMLLEYLAAEGGTEPASASQGNISAAMATIQTFTQELESRSLSSSRSHERLLQTAARLLYHHATHGPYRPTYLHTHLQRFIALFPRNALFLSLFAWSQPALRIIDDPVRTLLQDLSLSNPHIDSLAARRFAIRHEARAGTAHSVRAAFEAALESPACKGSVELWVAYVRFCCGRRELRAKAREVWYRAIGACPWAKEVYMLGFAVAGLGLGPGELRGVVEGMVEKGLRVHVDMEEFLAAKGGKVR
ncbi:hypothetical protein NEMBOFW57_000333 [Staphylotrichum longicolle]|uniref:DUF1740-domain-containing protein n=1 Tax=Staphylotrichum longicolle TaxID=669026 RepID=A0AAD4F3W9_9PEZI|nr:hypothetical protein NEMBOFW57_000333 [Staphylotrichum longicolle]